MARQRERLNHGIDFEMCESKWLRGPDSPINLFALYGSVAQLCAKTKEKTKSDKILSLLQAVSVLDLTTLSGDDTSSNVLRLCNKAAEPLSRELLTKLSFPTTGDLSCGAVCVYPAQVSTCVEELKKINSHLPVAAVAGGFPSGQYHLNTKLDEIKGCIENGASEIDVVISREYVLCGDWRKLYNEVKFMRQAAENCTLKVIISSGELGTMSNIYRASIVCMAAGADFIKTSTGKESVNATLTVGTVMARAIKHYYQETTFPVGFKPAGGIRTCKEVYLWQELMRTELSEYWVIHRHLFRIGASGLLNDIEETLTRYTTPNVSRGYMITFV